MSAFVPGFANDIFVSYAHDDDARWVRTFVEALDEEVSRRLGLEASIWQDTSQVRAGNNWNDAIHDGIKGTAVFVAVVSPRYQNSQWCARERQLFRDCLGSDTELEKSGRFFKVVKTPWPGNGHREFYANVQDVEFFKDDEDGEEEFGIGTREFKRAIRKMADGVERLLRRMRRGHQRVHIAWPGDDCVATWRQLSDELKTQGFDIQPTGPRDSSFGDSLLRDDIDQSVLSIHMLGSAYDPFSERMIHVAADLDRQLLFWVSGGAHERRADRQQALIDTVGRGLRPGASQTLPTGWTLLSNTGVRELIDAILSRLRPQRQLSETLSSSAASMMYIVHDTTTPEDTQVAMRLKDQIRSKESIDVFVSRTDSTSLMDLKLRHEQLLKSCDGVLLYRNAAPEGWWNQLAPEVLLMERRFERRPLKSRAFLLTQPGTDLGADLGGQVRIIPYTSSFELADLEPFLSPLRP